MQVLKYILIVVDTILALATVILVMLQKNDDKGASSTITGAASNNYLDKNKGRTREGKIKRMTIVFGIVFVIMAFGLNILYALA
jgi:preprotein translocase subunit SecG